MTTEKQNLRLDRIRIDGGTQPRVEIDQVVVSDYADLYRQNRDLKPVVVFFDGATYWLADGFHRYWAKRETNCNQIFAEVHQGSQRDAILYSVGANADHGLRRSNDDKRKAVKTMLTDPKVCRDDEGRPWSDREIARRCNVSHPFVANLRDELTPDDTGNVTSMDGESDAQRSFIHPKTGKPTTMNTTNIGRGLRSRPRPNAKPVGGISPNAMTPIRGHSTHQPKTALELPHDPHWACRAILSAMGHDFARALIKELSAYLEGASE